MVLVAENQAKTLTCSHMQFPTMSTEVNTATRNLKFKITTKGIWKNSEYKSQNNLKKDTVIGSGNKGYELNVLVKPSMPEKSCKRRPEVSLDGQSAKRRKMDRTLKLQCGNILREMMNHRGGWIFSEPVDPVKLKIPDYFSIISNPMDLGTIKRRLEGNMYFGAEEFAADVKLTFSNAMVYNPSWHEVHTLAKELYGNFCRRWKSLESKLKHEDTNGEMAISHSENNGQTTKQTVENNYQESKPIGHNKESFDSSGGDKSSWKLKTELRGVMGAINEKVKPARIALKLCSSLRRTVQKETCSQNASSAPANQSQSLDSARAKCSSCVSLQCHCRLKNGSAQSSTSDVSSERSSENNQCGDFKLGREVNCPLAFHRTSVGLDSDGSGVVLNEEKSPHCTPSATVASVEGLAAFNVQMSPDKALRAAMLKSRFADTIFRATHQVDKSDPLKMQQERERLEREKQEEKARIEAEIKAAEAASRLRKQNEMKMKREKERAAARMALQKMEKTIEIYENMDILKDVEILCYDSLSVKPLERLGLFLKDDHLEEEEEDAKLNPEEEGEILS